MLVKLTFAEATSLHNNIKVYPLLPVTMRDKITSMMFTRDELASFVKIMPAYITEFDINDTLRLSGARSIVAELLTLDINGLFDGDTTVHCQIASIGMMFEFIAENPGSDHNFLEKMLSIVNDELLWRVQLLIGKIEL